MDYERELGRELWALKRPPSQRPKQSDREWAEQKLAELMEEFQFNREKALELMRQDAPTIYGWLVAG
jgi:hypothetical protein